MDAPPAREASPAGAPSDQRQPAGSIFRKYYTENDSVLSPEAILKVLSAIACLVSSVLLLSGGSCAGAAALVPSAGAAALACAALSALLYVAGALALPLYAPQAWLFTDIILSTVMGVLLLVMAVLTMTVCEMNNFTGYVLGPLGIVNAGMVIGSAVITYVSVMRLWDQSHPSVEPAPPLPLEQDV